ncbi:MAG: type II toxin-antitoxin system VapC family toxin [Gemmatimonadota bacterium]
MIFVDTNVWMYAVGGQHPLRREARAFLERSLVRGTALATSAEVLQEFLHAYLPVGRLATLEGAMTLARSRSAQIWSIEPRDVLLAHVLVDRHPELGARDLLHLASCRRREVRGLKTFDRALAAAFGRP